MTLHTPKTVSIVVPCFNEAEALPHFLRRIMPVADQTPAYAWEFLFVNDGSKDESERLLVEASAHDPRIKVLSLSRNFGHQRAISAGLDWCEGAYIAVIDADLQDPPEAIPEMLARLDEGFDVVHGVRTDRSADSWAKRTGAALFYRFMRRHVLPDLPENSGDFKAMNRKVLLAVSQYPERVRFLRGALATVGFRQTTVPYARAERSAGHSKYPFWKVVAFSRDAIFSNSIWPLRLALPTGLLVELILVGIVALRCGQAVFSDGPSPTLVEALLALGVGATGALLLFVGIMAEYLKILLFEVKHRPVYLVRQTWNLDPGARKSVRDYNSEHIGFH
ncbi:MAG: glycosyltransferase family 2 protein [Candidatus Hydrogenedentes bacterium]|nr:glycosyltransferase family 2 protein [Candidatus Hydrogenedentota bacterium]